MAEIKTVEQFIVESRLRPRIVRAAEVLRDLADTVERHASELDGVGKPGRELYAAVAGRVQAAVMNALPNLALDSLTSDAAAADVARARSRVAEEIATEVETTIGGYPDNEVKRPKVERGGHLNDAQWAAQIARSKKEG